MSGIDWSKQNRNYPLWLEGIGEHAKHSGWYRRCGEVFEHETHGQFRAAREGKFFRVFTKPEWTGEGLPPVGIDCETLWSSTTGEYVAVRVVGHDEDRAVVRFISSDRKGEYDSDRQHNDYGFPIFRPMRSAEDRAAEQALREIEQLYAEGGPAAVYDAGYRK